MYGVYKLIFYARMWDTDDEDPILTRKLPFIKVIKNSVVQQKGSNDVKILI